jgi:hypothetical protein
MPKSKTAPADISPAEPSKRASARTPKAPAAMHKRTAKKAVAPEPVRTISHEEISRRAYSYWEARHFQGGSPEEDWFRAERELLESSQDR